MNGASHRRDGRAASNASAPIQTRTLTVRTIPPALAKSLKFWDENFADRRIFLVYGAMRDKAVDEIAGLLFRARIR